MNGDHACARQSGVGNRKPFEGLFAAREVAAPLVIQPDRERWLQKLLSMQWLVVEFLRALPTLEGATCSKCCGECCDGALVDFAVVAVDRPVGFAGDHATDPVHERVRFDVLEVVALAQGSCSAQK